MTKLIFTLLFFSVYAVSPLISAGSVTVLPDTVAEVPVSFAGSGINAVVFELFYGGGVGYVGYEFALSSPFVGSCSDTGYSVQCFALGLGGLPLPALPSGQLFTLQFHAEQSSPLMFGSYSFGNVNGQSVMGNASDGAITVIDVDAGWPPLPDEPGKPAPVRVFLPVVEKGDLAHD